MWAAIPAASVDDKVITVDPIVVVRALMVTVLEEPTIDELLAVISEEE